MKQAILVTDKGKKKVTVSTKSGKGTETHEVVQANPNNFKYHNPTTSQNEGPYLSDHFPIKKDHSITWNILTKCAKGNNGFGISESPGEYVGRLELIADQIVTMLKDNKNQDLNHLLLQEVKSEYFDLFSDILNSKLNKAGLGHWQIADNNASIKDAKHPQGTKNNFRNLTLFNTNRLEIDKKQTEDAWKAANNHYGEGGSECVPFVFSDKNDSSKKELVINTHCSQGGFKSFFDFIGAVKKKFAVLKYICAGDFNKEFEKDIKNSADVKAAEGPDLFFGQSDEGTSFAFDKYNNKSTQLLKRDGFVSSEKGTPIEVLKDAVKFPSASPKPTSTVDPTPTSSGDSLSISVGGSTPLSKWNLEPVKEFLASQQKAGIPFYKDITFTELSDKSGIEIIFDKAKPKENVIIQDKDIYFSNSLDSEQFKNGLRIALDTFMKINEVSTHKSGKILLEASDFSEIQIKQLKDIIASESKYTGKFEFAPAKADNLTITSTGHATSPPTSAPSPTPSVTPGGGPTP